MNQAPTPAITVTPTLKVTIKDRGAVSDLNHPQKVGCTAAKKVLARRILETHGGKTIRASISQSAK